MMDNKTLHLGLPLPDLANQQDEDVPRIAEALVKLDGHAAQGDARMESAAEDLGRTVGRVVALEGTARALRDGIDSLAGRVAGVEAKSPDPAGPDKAGIGRVATLADMEPGAEIANGPAFPDVQGGVITPTPTPNAVPQADADGRVAVGWIPGGFVGDIRLLPFSPEDLAEGCPRWYFCNGDKYPLTSPVGLKLNALPTKFKSAWGIVVSGANISIPNMFHTDGRGYFARAVNGTVRTVGSIEQDAMQGHRHGGSFASSTLSNGGGGSGWYNTASVAVVGDPITDNVNGGPRTSRETRSLNAGMTPAIFLDV